MKPEYWDKAKRSLMRRDPVMGTIMRAHPICGQQISVKAAQSVWNRFCLVVPVISPEEVLKAKAKDVRACGFSDRKCEYILDLAQHFADGKIHVHRWPE